MKKNKTSQGLTCLLVCLILAGCNNYKSNKPDENSGIRGRFVNQTFLQQVPDTVAGAIQAYCYELNFINADSVMVNYGFESGTLLYKKAGDHYVLVNALQGHDLPFTFNMDSTITLKDSSWIKQGTAWMGTARQTTFKKATGIQGKGWLFDQYLNERVIAGTYQLYQQGKPKGRKVIFNKDGTVSGLENYISYTICYSGDCVGETETLSDQVTFKTATGTEVTYAFETGKDGTKSFYNIGPPLKDSDANDLKGGRAIREKAFALKRYPDSAR